MFIIYSFENIISIKKITYICLLYFFQYPNEKITYEQKCLMRKLIKEFIKHIRQSKKKSKADQLQNMQAQEKNLLKMIKTIKIQ